MAMSCFAGGFPKAEGDGGPVQRQPWWRQRLLSRFLVEVDLGDGWRPVPALRLAPDPSAPLPDPAHRALAQVKRVRVLFPVE
jgi:hypothetical protein